MKKLSPEEMMNKHGVLQGYRNIQNIRAAMIDYSGQEGAALREQYHATLHNLERACIELRQIRKRINAGLPINTRTAERIEAFLSEVNNKLV